MNINKNPLVSICCLGYNHARFLENNLTSIWNNTYKNIEIIVVDDGSSDESQNLLKKLQNVSPCPMTLILQENTGNIGLNFNIASKSANGELIMFMAMDDMLYSDAIEKEVAYFNENDHLAFVASSKIMGIDDEGCINDSIDELDLRKIENPSLDDILQLEFEKFGAFYIQGTLFNKKIIDAVGGFDEDMTGDDLILRIKVLRYMQEHKLWNFQILSDPTCYYRQHENNIHRNMVRQIKIVTEYLERYWPKSDNPDSLIKWTKHAIRNLSFEKGLEIFTLNKRANLLLLNPEIQAEIKNSILRKHRFWYFLYHKEKMNKKRKITLFSCIKFTYKKK